MEAKKVHEENYLTETAAHVQSGNFQNLIDSIQDLQKENLELRSNMDAFELKIRHEVCHGYETMMSKMEKQYKGRLRRIEQDYEELMEQRISLQRRALTADFEDGDTTIEVMDCSLEEFPNETSEAVETNDFNVPYEDDSSSLAKRKHELLSELEIVQRETAILEIRCKTLQKEKEQCLAEADTLTAQNKALNAEKAELQQEISVLLEKMNSYTTKESLDRGKTEIVRLMESLREAHSLLEDMRSKELSEIELEDLYIAYQALLDEIVSLKQLHYHKNKVRHVMFENQNLEHNAKYKKVLRVVLNEKIASEEPELHQSPKAMNTRSRKKAAGLENLVPKKSWRLVAQSPTLLARESSRVPTDTVSTRSNSRRRAALQDRSK